MSSNSNYNPLAYRNGMYQTMVNEQNMNETYVDCCSKKIICNVFSFIYNLKRFILKIEIKKLICSKF
jgi:hypothetical protein